MTATPLPEVWLRGPLPDVPALFQPVAHELLQCREELRAALAGLTPTQLVARPGDVASVAYHVVHAIGSLDRLLTYARGESLSREQLAYLGDEPRAGESVHGSAALVALFGAAVDRALIQIRAIDPSTALDAREVGRAKLPSTVIGLLFHAAEHTQRHVGQLVTTAKIVRSLVSAS
ncbi:MAG TPA: DinB family protein [Gemmatimonadaceae bacterium]|nr:DinB family protein [Gemmatimonadaceae bacterium]